MLETTASVCQQEECEDLVVGVSGCVVDCSVV